MRRLFFLMIFLSSGIMIYPQTAKEKLMPVTTTSKSALMLYDKAMKYSDEVYMDKALESFHKALKEDPDFFMANYQLAIYYFLNQAPDDFEEYSDAAISCKASLSDAEEILRDALSGLKEGRKNIVSLGEKLTDMYPDDPDAYNNLVYFQSIANDYEGMVGTLKKAIRIARDPATFYNQLGYAYLSLKKSDDAEEAFNKYIELEPDNPNVYDSKGDYFMYMKKYDKAYESYMKAYSMDTSFSRNKAEVARKLFEQSEGRRIEIIPM